MAEPSKRRFRRAVIVLAVIGGLVVVGGVVTHLVAGVYLFNNHFAPTDGIQNLAVGEMAGLEVADAPAPAPDRPFLSSEGGQTTLADFQGRVAVVNLWAMWCAPCREEMPTLAALQTAYDPAEVVVVAINVDGDPAQEGPAKEFLADHAPLDFYREPEFRLPFDLPGAGAMPQTVLLDRQGRIRAWKNGAADWSSPEARAVIDALRRE